MEEARGAAACRLERALCGLVVSSVLIGSRRTWRILNVRLCVLVLPAPLLARFWVMTSALVPQQLAAPSPAPLPSVSHTGLLSHILLWLLRGYFLLSLLRVKKINRDVLLSFLSGNGLLAEQNINL